MQVHKINFDNQNQFLLHGHLWKMATLMEAMLLTDQISLESLDYRAIQV